MTNIFIGKNLTFNISLNKSSMSNFYVILPSNTNVEGNRTNSFRVRLPKKLQFNSEWLVGLAVFVYPHTWPSLGTSEAQYLRVIWKTGDRMEVALPSQNFANPSELLKKLKESLYTGSQDMVKKLRTIQYDMIGMRNQWDKQIDELMAIKKGKMVSREKDEEKPPQGDKPVEDVDKQKEETDEAEKKERHAHFQRLRQDAIAKMDKETQRILTATADLGLAAWIEAFRRIKYACSIDFEQSTQRFKVTMDSRYIDRVELSEQLAYILGFTSNTITQTTSAKFAPDMKGGVSSFYIYAPGLIEPVIIGDVSAPILRVVTIRGWPDDLIEETYMPIQYQRVLIKEISEIFIEIRTPSGALMPFQYGTCTLTLHFRKAAYF